MFTTFTSTSYIICFIWSFKKWNYTQRFIILWLKLSEPDPFLYITCFLNGAVSFLQQKINGTADSNPQMKKYDVFFQ